MVDNTNAERQRRYIARLKQRAAAADQRGVTNATTAAEIVGASAPTVATVRSEMGAHNGQVGQNAHSPRERVRKVLADNPDLSKFVTHAPTRRAATMGTRRMKLRDALMLQEGDRGKGRAPSSARGMSSRASICAQQEDAMTSNNDAEKSAAGMKQWFAKVDEACRSHPDIARQLDVALAAHDRSEIVRLCAWLEARG